MNKTIIVICNILALSILKISCMESDETIREKTAEYMGTNGITVMNYTPYTLFVLKKDDKNEYIKTDIIPKRTIIETITPIDKTSIIVLENSRIYCDFPREKKTDDPKDIIINVICKPYTPNLQNYEEIQSINPDRPIFFRFMNKGRPKSKFTTIPMKIFDEGETDYTIENTEKTNDENKEKSSKFDILSLLNSDSVLSLKEYIENLKASNSENQNNTTENSN